MSGETDRLLKLAQEATPAPDERELDTGKARDVPKGCQYVSEEECLLGRCQIAACNSCFSASAPPGAVRMDGEQRPRR